MAELMTVEELGPYLRLTRKTIYKLLKQGGIPAIRIGKKWRFDKEAIDKWLRQNMESAKAHILVVDDDELVRSLFKETLEEEGHTVITADNGAKGLAYIIQQDFDLIFLDLKLPGTDGAEILREMRGVKQGLPVIIITGYPGSEMMERALEQGPLSVMPKPFGASAVVTMVNSLLRVKKPGV